MTAFYFTRHGESQANVDKVFAGWADSPLTEKGRRDARDEGKRLAAEGVGFDLILSSPLARAHDTAKIIAEELGYPLEKIVVLEKLKERHAGDFEGMPSNTLDGQPKKIDAIGSAGGETREAFASRVDEAFAIIRRESHGHENVLIVAHAGWYKMAVSLIEHKDIHVFYTLPSPANNQVVGFPL